MIAKYVAPACAGVFASLLVFLPARAEVNITEREKRDCRVDYNKYCGEYGLGSNALRACMSRNIKKISNVCVAALVDADELTQAEADKLRKKATVKKPVKKTVVRKKK